MPVAPEYLHLVYPNEEFTAFLYGRASHDPTKRGRSVSSQLGEGRELCEQFGWPVVGVFDKDVDRSASRHAKTKRADFEAMIEGIIARRCRIVVAWEASRYYRDLDAYVRLRTACYEAGVLLCYNGQVFDLSKREDRKATARDALDAEDEAEGIRDRNLRTHRKLAEKGAPAGRVPWGYTRRYDPATGDLLEQVAHPERGSVVKELYTRFAAGWTMYRLAQWLNSPEGEPFADGVEWNVDRVSNQLRIQAYAGRRVHQGEVARDALWKALVTPELFDQVQEILDDPARAWTRDTAVVHLLSGISYCGEHGDELPKQRVVKGTPARRYSCPHQDTTLRKDWFEAYVEEAVIEWLSSPRAREAFQQDDQQVEAAAARALVKALEQQLDEARELAGTIGEDGVPGLSPLSLAAMERRLAPQITAQKARARAVSASVPPLLTRLLTAADVDREWEGLEIEQKRDVIRRVVTVRLFRAHAKGVKKILPGRITLSFVGEPGFMGG